MGAVVLVTVLGPAEGGVCDSSRHRSRPAGSELLVSGCSTINVTAVTQHRALSR